MQSECDRLGLHNGPPKANSHLKLSGPLARHPGKGTTLILFNPAMIVEHRSRKQLTTYIGDSNVVHFGLSA